MVSDTACPYPASFCARCIVLNLANMVRNVSSTLHVAIARCRKSGRRTAPTEASRMGVKPVSTIDRPAVFKAEQQMRTLLALADDLSTFPTRVYRDGLGHCQEWQHVTLVRNMRNYIGNVEALRRVSRFQIPNTWAPHPRSLPLSLFCSQVTVYYFAVDYIYSFPLLSFETRN